MCQLRTPYQESLLQTSHLDIFILPKNTTYTKSILTGLFSK